MTSTTRRRLLTAAVALPCAGVAGKATAEPEREPDFRQLVEDIKKLKPPYRKVVFDSARTLAEIKRTRMAGEGVS